MRSAKRGRRAPPSVALSGGSHGRDVAVASYTQSRLIDPHELLRRRLRARATLPPRLCSSNNRDRHLRPAQPIISVAALSSNAVLACDSAASGLRLWRFNSDSSQQVEQVDSSSYSYRVMVPEGCGGSRVFTLGQDGLRVLDGETLVTTAVPRDFFVEAHDIREGDCSMGGDLCVMAGAIGDDRLMQSVLLYDVRSVSSGPVSSITPTVLLQTLYKETAGDVSRIRFLGTGLHIAVLLEPEQQDDVVQVYDLRKLGSRQPMTEVRVSGDVEPARWHEGAMLPASGRHTNRVSMLASMGGEGGGGGSVMFCTGASGEGLRLWDASTGRCVEHFSTCGSWAEPKFSSSGSGRGNVPSMYAYCEQRGSVVEFTVNDPTTPLCSFSRPAYWGRETSLALVGSGDGLVCGNSNGELLAWV